MRHHATFWSLPPSPPHFHFTVLADHPKRSKPSAYTHTALSNDKFEFAFHCQLVSIHLYRYCLQFSLVQFFVSFSATPPSSFSISSLLFTQFIGSYTVSSFIDGALPVRNTQLQLNGCITDNKLHFCLFSLDLAHISAYVFASFFFSFCSSTFRKVHRPNSERNYNYWAFLSANMFGMWVST